MCGDGLIVLFDSINITRPHAAFAHTSPANFRARRALPASALPGTDDAPPTVGRVGVASELDEAPELPAQGNICTDAA